MIQYYLLCWGPIVEHCLPNANDTNDNNEKLSRAKTKRAHDDDDRMSYRNLFVACAIYFYLNISLCYIFELRIFSLPLWPKPIKSRIGLTWMWRVLAASTLRPFLFVRIWFIRKRTQINTDKWRMFEETQVGCTT